MDLRLGNGFNNVQAERLIQKRNEEKGKEEPKVAEERVDSSKPVVEEKPVAVRADEVNEIYARASFAIASGKVKSAEFSDGGHERGLDELITQYNKMMSSTSKVLYEDVIEILDCIIKACESEDDKVTWTLEKVNFIQNHQITMLNTKLHMNPEDVNFDEVLEPWSFLFEENYNIEMGGTTEDLNEPYDVLCNYMYLIENGQPILNPDADPEIVHNALIADLQSWKILAAALSLKLKDPSISNELRSKLQERLDYCQDFISYMKEVLGLE